MSSADWQQVEKVLHGALALAGGERDAFLDRRCPTPSLRREVEALLHADEDAASFLDWPTRVISPTQESSRSAPGEQDRIGPYRLLREIGAGGMGSVYLAVRDDEHFRQKVAIKRVHSGPATRELLRRFRTERQILARLEHPNIARILDGGADDDGRLYFVLEFVDGQPIDRYCQDRELPLRRRLEIFLEVCSAVSYAQQNLIVHRDLKPGNILVTEEGTPKLLDFGIAKILGPGTLPLPVERTVTHLRPMTPQYASPEQLRQEPVTTATDVYALGLVLFEVLTGRRPYSVRGLSPTQVERVVCEHPPVRPSTVVARSAGDAAVRRSLRPGQLRGDLDNIVLKALAKDRERRYASSRHLQEDLERYLAGRPVVARQATWSYRARKFLRRHSLAAGAAAVTLTVTVAFLLALLVQASRLERERDQARQQRDRAEEVSAFLVDIFSEADPSRARGQTLTAREILDRGVSKIDRGLTDQPDLRARLMATMADAYGALGIYDPAIVLRERSLEHLRSLPDADLEVARGLESLAELWGDKAEFGKAEELLGEALALRRPHGEGPVAEGLFHLAAQRFDQGRYDESAEVSRETLAIQTRVHGRDHPATARTLNNLALTLEIQGDPSALELYREALEIYRRHEGADHPEVATILHNLGSLHFTHGDFARAREQLREALEMRRRILGPEHPKTSKTQANLSVALVELGELDEALRHALESLDSRRRTFGDDHLQPAHSLYLIAFIHSRSGELEAAEARYREALEIQRRSLPAGHAVLANGLFALGALLAGSERCEDAEPLLREALEIRRRALPEHHPLTVRAASELGYCLAELRQFEPAEPLLRAAYESSREGADEDGRQAAARLIALYEAWGKPGRAEELRALRSGNPG